MDRNLALEFVRITEAAALSCMRFIGRGDEKSADQAAVDAMRRSFDYVPVNGTIVIGEGERDEAPMLYIGEKVGTQAPDVPHVDIALDPLEGTTICANGSVGAISVIAVAEEGKFLHSPDVYMDKIACGPAARGMIDLDAPPAENIHRVAEANRKTVEDLVVVIMDRPRHQELIRSVRKTGARIHLISDGDISAALASAWWESGIDMLMGIGGAPEGVISAAALRCLRGDMQGRLIFRNEAEKERAAKMGIRDFNRKYTLDELAGGKTMFVATGVTDGPFLRGCRVLPGRKVVTNSVVMRSVSGTVRTMEAFHNLDRKLRG